MRMHFRFLAVLLLALFAAAAQAGSYDDWFRAVKQDNPAAVKALLQRGFDADTPDPAGKSALFLAIQEGSLKVAQALIEWPKTNVETRSDKDESPLMLAALRGYKDLARKLIDRGADVNKTGWTPLHYAATRGHVEIMAMLLEEHAYIDAESPNKTTPLMMAAKYGTPEAVKLLLNEGADPTLRNELGLNAIEFAQQAERRDAADMIAAAIRSRQPRGKW